MELTELAAASKPAQKPADFRRCGSKSFERSGNLGGRIGQLLPAVRRFPTGRKSPVADMGAPPGLEL
jgi:hypothetical protein